MRGGQRVVVRVGRVKIAARGPTAKEALPTIAPDVIVHVQQKEEVEDERNKEAHGQHDQDDQIGCLGVWHDGQTKPRRNVIVNHEQIFNRISLAFDRVIRPDAQKDRSNQNSDHTIESNQFPEPTFE